MMPINSPTIAKVKRCLLPIIISAPKSRQAQIETVSLLLALVRINPLNGSRDG